MAVNEAPWLTRRVEIALMALTFLVCLLADTMRRKNGHVLGCAGDGVDVPWGEEIAGRDEAEECACADRNASRVVLHLLEFGPVGAPLSDANDSKNGKGIFGRAPITSLVASALQNRTGNVILINASGGLFGAELFASLREDIGLRQFPAGTCAKVPGTLNISYSFDGVPVPLSSSLLADMKSVFSSKSDYFALRRHLPGLYRRFNQLVAEERKRPATPKDPCERLHLIIVVAVIPGMNTTWIDENATLVPNVLLDAHKYVQKTVSHYIRKKPRYRRLLDSLWYIGVPVGFPLHDAANAVSSSLDDASGGSGGGGGADSRDLPGKNRSDGSNVSAVDFSLKFCSASRKNFDLCRGRCAIYGGELRSYRAANAGLQRLTEPRKEGVGTRSLILPFRDHFHPERAVLSSHWRDCLSMSADGAEVMARSIASCFFTSVGAGWMRHCAVIAVRNATFITFASFPHGGRRECHSAGGPYRSATAFKLRPCEVNETNVPTAREVAAMIPSRAELQRQLPSARDLEAQYVRARAAQEPLWPDSDTPEDIMAEERYGAEGAEAAPSPSPQHVLLAWRALMWGTLYAVAGVTFVVWAVMRMCGMRGVGDVLAHQRGHAERERRRLEAEGQDVVHFVLDLTNPTAVVQQARDIWRALEDLAEDKEEEEEEERISR